MARTQKFSKNVTKWCLVGLFY
uniref:Uncharacterized protein n=1 Tax=Arundo donax TaxID=35708 RepID=A0A0A9C5U9_ARUDO